MLNKQNEKLLQELLKKYKQGIISGLYPGNNITFTPTGCRDKIISSTGGGVQDIPLTGTEVGSPVTGDIELYNTGDDATGYLKYNASDGFFMFGNDEIYVSGAALHSKELGGNNYITVNPEKVLIGTLNSGYQGIGGTNDFSANITDLDYTQKIYVDSAVNAIRPYEVYTAIITQTGTDAPTAVVLQNTLGITPTLTRFATGNYRITASNTFTANKTFCIVGQEANSGTGMNYIWASDSNDDEVLLQTYDGAGLGAALTDDKMDRLSVEIRVYK